MLPWNVEYERLRLSGWVDQLLGVPWGSGLPAKDPLKLPIYDHVRRDIADYLNSMVRSPAVLKAMVKAWRRKPAGRRATTGARNSRIAFYCDLAEELFPKAAGKAATLTARAFGLKGKRPAQQVYKIRKSCKAGANWVSWTQCERARLAGKYPEAKGSELLRKMMIELLQSQ